MLFSRRLMPELMANQQRALALAEQLVALVENAADPNDPALDPEKFRLAQALEQETNTTEALVAAVHRARRRDAALMWLVFAGAVALAVGVVGFQWNQAHPG
jgi:hypothetical protein